MPLLTSPRPLFRHLYADFYQMGEDMLYKDPKTGIEYLVKKKAIWDMGSILKIIPRWIVPHSDEMTYPSALHDKFYGDFSVTKWVADRILRRFLIEEGLARWRAQLAWLAVRMNLKASLAWGK